MTDDMKKRLDDLKKAGINAEPLLRYMAIRLPDADFLILAAQTLGGEPAEYREFLPVYPPPPPPKPKPRPLPPMPPLRERRRLEREGK